MWEKCTRFGTTRRGFYTVAPTSVQVVFGAKGRMSAVFTNGKSAEGGGRGRGLVRGDGVEIVAAAIEAVRENSVMARETETNSDIGIETAKTGHLR